MRRRWGLGILILTHIAVAALVAVIVAGTKIGERFEVYAGDPMYRLGVRLSDVDGVDSLFDSSFEEDVERASQGAPAPLADVIRLVKHLKGPAHHTDLSEAENLCSALGWRRCDRERLAEMQRILAP